MAEASKGTNGGFPADTRPPIKGGTAVYITVGILWRNRLVGHFGEIQTHNLNSSTKRFY